MSEYSAGLGGDALNCLDIPLAVLESYSLTSAAYLSSIKYKNVFMCYQDTK